MAKADKEKHGRSLERTIASIESAFNAFPGARITSPARLRDKDTGQLREFDVLIEYEQGHHEVKISLECRDRSRKVNVGEVEAYKAKCDVVGIDGRMIVSSKGYFKTALRKAEKYGIQCLSLRAVESFKWLEARTVTQYERSISHIGFIPIIDTDDEECQRDYVLIDENDGLADMQRLRAPLMQEAYRRMEDRAAENAQMQFPLRINGLRMRFRDMGEVVPVLGVQAEIRYDIRVTQSPFRLARYTGITPARLSPTRHPNHKQTSRAMPNWHEVLDELKEAGSTHDQISRKEVSEAR